MEGFYICSECGAGFTSQKAQHKNLSGSVCDSSLAQYSLGHEFVTDVVRLQFENLTDQWDAYSLAYAILLGAEKTLDVPNTDLSVTITRGKPSGASAIVLYDDVPGGAGLVAQLEQEKVFREMLIQARDRVQGACGCDLSCYGCLRSYRNQFAHPYLNRERALEFLNDNPGFPHGCNAKPASIPTLKAIQDPGKV